MRFAIRRGKLADAEAIARAHTASWRTSYRGILPDAVLDRIDVDQRASSWRRTLQDPSILTLVAYDTTHHDIVELCDAGRTRGDCRYAAEVYRIYIEHHGKRYSLGREMFEQVTDWLRSHRTCGTGCSPRSTLVPTCESQPIGRPSSSIENMGRLKLDDASGCE